MFPTLASLVEERLKDDPDLIHDIIHALNEVGCTRPGSSTTRTASSPPGHHAADRRPRAGELESGVRKRGAKTVLVRLARYPASGEHAPSAPRSSIRSGRPA